MPDRHHEQPRHVHANAGSGVTAMEPVSGSAAPSATPPAGRSWRSAATAVIGSLLGAVPHVLHHIGLLAGAAVLGGVTGNAVLYVLGLVFTVPLLRRLHRRFGTWAAPAVATAVFTGLFALSALVIGPALAGNSAAGTGTPTPTVSVVSVPPSAPTSAPISAPTDEHAGHHP